MILRCLLCQAADIAALSWSPGVGDGQRGYEDCWKSLLLGPMTSAKMEMTIQRFSSAIGVHSPRTLGLASDADVDDGVAVAVWSSPVPVSWLCFAPLKPVPTLTAEVLCSPVGYQPRQQVVLNRQIMGREPICTTDEEN